MRYRLKYYSLNKEEKGKLLNDYKQTDSGNAQIRRLKRLFIIGIISVLFSIYMISTYTSVWDLVSGITLLIAGILFIICSYRLRIKNLNNFLIKKKK